MLGCQRIEFGLRADTQFLTVKIQLALKIQLAIAFLHVLKHALLHANDTYGTWRV